MMKISLSDVNAERVQLSIKSDLRMKQLIESMYSQNTEMLKRRKHDEFDDERANVDKMQYKRHNSHSFLFEAERGTSTTPVPREIVSDPLARKESPVVDKRNTVASNSSYRDSTSTSNSTSTGTSTSGGANLKRGSFFEIEEVQLSLKHYIYVIWTDLTDSHGVTVQWSIMFPGSIQWSKWPDSIPASSFVDWTVLYRPGMRLLKTSNVYSGPSGTRVLATIFNGNSTEFLGSCSFRTNTSLIPINRISIANYTAAFPPKRFYFTAPATTDSPNDNNAQVKGHNCLMCKTKMRLLTQNKSVWVCKHPKHSGPNAFSALDTPLFCPNACCPDETYWVSCVQCLRRSEDETAPKKKKKKKKIRYDQNFRDHLAMRIGDQTDVLSNRYSMT